MCSLDRLFGGKRVNLDIITTTPWFHHHMVIQFPASFLTVFQLNQEGAAYIDKAAVIETNMTIKLQTLK
ncbi:hypothetical protein [Bacillus atrophaeus]|uniref:hypothetical protein n=1 Tax=Bacillus atrophaeus TaxID=1452 RepID=UPI0012FE2FA7|nr:hypothetical protein [Bacillus atrophaeus]